MKLGTNPKYNLASTGGHESDRDLVSYVRGVAGAGDGSGGQPHIARPGKTISGISATLAGSGPAPLKARPSARGRAGCRSPCPG